MIIRKRKNRIKGRDWYDFEWYVKNNYSVNLEHLTTRAMENLDINTNETFNSINLKTILLEKINNVDFKSAKDDIKRFTDNNIVIWSKEYFRDIVQIMK